MLKLYVERQNVMSYRSAVINAHCNVKSKDRRDPTVQRVKEDTITSNDVTCGDVMHGDVTSVKDSKVKVAETPKGGDFHLECDHTYPYSPIPFEARQI